MNEDNNYQGLDLEIEIVKIEQELNNGIQQINKNFKKRIFGLIILIISLGMVHFIPNLITLLIFLSSLGGLVATDYLLDKKFKKNNESKEIELNSIIKSDENTMVKNNSENYLKSDIKNINQIITLDKNDISQIVIEELLSLYPNNNLPVIIMTNHEWSFFIDSLYDLFEEKEITDQFYTNLSKIVRFTVATAIVNKSNSIRIQDFIINLSNLHNIYGLDSINEDLVSKKEVLILQKQIATNLQISKKEIPIIYKKKIK